MSYSSGFPAGDYRQLPDTLKPTAALYETIPRWGYMQNGAAPASGALWMYGIYLPANTTVTSITFFSGTTALATGSNQWFALFSSARAKLGITADDTSTAWAANSAKTLALTTPYTTTAGGLYYLGRLIVATTVPTTLTITNNAAVLMALTPILAGFADTGLTNPASCPATAAALTASAQLNYAYVS